MALQPTPLRCPMKPSFLVSLILTAVRAVGVVLALRILHILYNALRFAGSNYQWSKYFLWHQILPGYVPQFILLILLLLPFSRIRSPLLWRGLLLAVVSLSLLWFVPEIPVAFVPHLTYLGPAPRHEREDVPQKIIIARSYRHNSALPVVTAIAGFLLTQIGAIWYTRHRWAILPDSHYI